MFPGEGYGLRALTKAPAEPRRTRCIDAQQTLQYPAKNSLAGFSNETRLARVYEQSVIFGNGQFFYSSSPLVPAFRVLSVLGSFHLSRGFTRETGADVSRGYREMCNINSRFFPLVIITDAKFMPRNLKSLTVNRYFLRRTTDMPNITDIFLRYSILSKNQVLILQVPLRAKSVRNKG